VPSIPLPAEGYAAGRGTASIPALRPDSAAAGRALQPAAPDGGFAG